MYPTKMVALVVGHAMFRRSLSGGFARQSQETRERFSLKAKPNMIIGNVILHMIMQRKASPTNGRISEIADIR